MVRCDSVAGPRRLLSGLELPSCTLQKMCQIPEMAETFGGEASFEGMWLLVVALGVVVTDVY